MALIKCEECKKQISDKAKNCPHCGYEVILCPECNAKIDKNALSCSNCGYRNTLSSENSKGKNYGLGIAALVCSFLVPLLGLIFGIIAMCSNPTETEAKGYGRTATILSIIFMALSFIIGLILLNYYADFIYDLMYYYN